MNTIETTLKNFSFISELNAILPDTEGFEYTKKGVIRAIKIPVCPETGVMCVRNGWDSLTRKGLFSLKIGKFRSPNTGKTIRPHIGFWQRLIGEWEETLSSFFLRLTDKDVALRVISELMNFLSPMSKDSVMRRVFSAIKSLIIPKIQTKYQIVHYDEQHPKKGRQQQYRLTLIDAITRDVIADELVNDKNYETVRIFLSSNLDITKETIIITDDCPWYPGVFEDIWGQKVKHQLCILHLNKLIVKDCGKVATIQEMYNTYLLLNIFLDRKKELLFLELLLAEQREKASTKDWLKNAKKRFNIFVRNLEKMRRRENMNHTLWSLDEATKTFEKLQREHQLLPKPLQKRIKYIENHWQEFTLFYKIKDCPHTNNVIENYFSTSLKTHRKKQFRTEEGLENKIRLSHFKRNVTFAKPIKSFFYWGKIFWILGG